MAGRTLSTLPTFAYAGGGCLHRVVEQTAAAQGGGDTQSTQEKEKEKEKDEEEEEEEEEVGGACLLGDSIHTVKPYFGGGRCKLQARLTHGPFFRKAPPGLKNDVSKTLN